jgi:hypothetical protein
VKNEHIDETIDRVAAELTAVPSGSSFAARLRDRLSQRRRPSTVPLLVSATAAVIAVAVLARFAPSTPEQPTLAGGGVEPRRGEPGIATGISPFASGALEDKPGEKTADAAEPTAFDPAEFDADSHPVDSPALAALIVDELIVDAVDVAPLGIDTLEISDIDTGELPKEPF